MLQELHGKVHSIRLARYLSITASLQAQDVTNQDPHADNRCVMQHQKADLETRSAMDVAKRAVQLFEGLYQSFSMFHTLG